METKKRFEVAILGGGITGSSIFNILSRYTNIDSACLIEKCESLGKINSDGKNNSQTLHFGDIESNYSLEKATSTKEASEMVVSYLESLGKEGEKIYSKSSKMLLAVGKKEIKKLEERFEEFKFLFPNLKKIERDEIARLEPFLVKERRKNEEILACYEKEGYVIDFGMLAKKLAEQAQETKNGFELFLETKVLDIRESGNDYEIITDKETFFAQTVVVAMCSHSLMFAKRLGYGKEFSILPVGGNFYSSSRKVLNGKVYTMQDRKMPFAGVHGDPDVHRPEITRFGPSSNIMPFLERNNLSTFSDFLRTSFSDPGSVLALFRLLSDKNLSIFLLKNLVYELPYLGPRAYAKLCQKIIPSLKYEDFRDGKSKAGIRPQLVDNKTGKFKMGEAEIEGRKIIFHISPSPGATVCFKSAEKTTRKVMRFLGEKYSFDEKKFKNDFF